MNPSQVIPTPNSLTTHEGATAYPIGPAQELFSMAATSFMEDTFYESGSEQFTRMAALIKQVGPMFTTKLAVYARREMNMRSFPVAMAVANAHIHQELADRATVMAGIQGVIVRADEVRVVMDLAMALNSPNWKDNKGQTKKSSKLNKAVVKAVANVLASGKFSEFDFAKYKGGSKGLPSFKDIIRLTHPKATTKIGSDVLGKVIDDTLSTPETWETQLSAAGSDEQAKRDVWEHLIIQNKLGYMALMRNLRNILKADISDSVFDLVIEKLGDEKQIARSRQLPFRFYSAYREMSDVYRDRYGYDQDDWTKSVPDARLAAVKGTMERAALLSAKNLPDFDKVMIGADVSASMMHPVSQRSSVQQMDIGLLMGNLLRAACTNAQFGFFGDTFKVIKENAKEPIKNALNMREREGEVGYSTNGYTVLEHIIKNKTDVNDVMLFTDCQMWPADGDYSHHADSGLSPRWNTIRQRNPNARLWLFDLAGHGRMPLRIDEQKNVIHVAGWSDKIFQAVEMLLNGGNIVKSIESYTWSP